MEKSREIKLSILQGVVSILLSTLIVTRIISDVAEYEFEIYQYVIIYTVSVLATLFIVTIIMMFVTSLEAFLIMLIDKKFSLRNLLLVNYSFFGKCILASSVLIYILYEDFNSTICQIAVLVTALLVALFIFLNYYSLVKVAIVNKKAAKAITTVMLIIMAVFNTATLI